MEVELPWPPKGVSPNAKRRSHWSSYSAKVKKYREDCSFLVKAAKAKGELLGVTFYPPNRLWDDDGMIGAFKSGRDGIADALGTNDNTFRPVYSFGEVRKNGLVVAIIGERPQGAPEQRETRSATPAAESPPLGFTASPYASVLDAKGGHGKA